MNNKDLFNAIGQIDDDLIFESTQPNTKHKSFSKIKRFCIAAAAALIIIAGVALGIPKLDNKGNVSVQSDFGIIVKAENSNENFTVDKNNKIVIPNTTIEKILKNIDDKNIYDISADDSVIKVTLNEDDTYSQELYIKNDDETVRFDAELQKDIVTLKNSNFDITFKNNKKIKSLLVSNKNGEIFPFYEDDVYKNRNNEIVIKWSPTHAIKQYLNEKSNCDYSKLSGDTLDISVVYTDNTKENYKVIFSWDKNGSLLVEMK